ncbi:MAG: sigma 54-interacting transcriptional regulator [Myxococcales bacterium]|nr:sigma 54-interacting transcriptional regulator [Myxococcales bacterium]
MSDRVYDSTVPLDFKAVKDLQERLAETEQPALLVRDGAGARVVPLPDGQLHVVGRCAPADVIVRDASLSREHAAFEAIGGVVMVEDLGSTNGVFVGGKRIEGRTEVAIGERVMLGHVAISVHRLDRTTAAIHRVGGPDALRERLVAEIARARDYGRPLALLVLRADDEAALERITPHIARDLRPYQLLSYYGAGILELLLPEHDDEQARAAAERFVALGREKHAPLSVGVGCVPQAATSADELIDVAFAAARRASPIGFARVRTTETSAAVRPPAGGAISRSAAMHALDELLERVADAAVPVLIRGETGAGKEVVARRIHAGSPRAAQPMVSINCGAIPGTLLESTLFGHEKGAFTGAESAAKGVFEAADGGTVFLDEVGELPAAAQVALLRILETKAVTRVGSTQERPVDVRVLAATHQPLESLCRDGAFRWDLYYRLNVMSLAVPPLRDRLEDISPLAETFLLAANEANGRSVKGIEPDALDALRCYGWPGNVRELRNAIERAVVVARGEHITRDDLPPSISGAQPMVPGDDAPPEAASTADTSADLRERLASFEAQLLREALARTGGSRADAARLLGLPVRTLAYKLKQHELA